MLADDARADRCRKADLEVVVERATSGGTVVRSIQSDLARLGYDPGPADGVAGAKTRTAIRSDREDRPLGALRGAVLSTSGRPLLFAPRDPRGRIEETVLVAWNGDTNSSRAIAAALPLLPHAKRVHVLTVRTAKSRSGEAERLREYLSFHGIAAEAEVATRSEEAVGAVLLRRRAISRRRSW